MDLYHRYKNAISKHSLPLMMVDLEKFDQNTDRLASLSNGKNVRLASKSLRVPWLLRRAQERHPHIFKGVMCFSLKEVEFLIEHKFQDFLLAYPKISKEEIELAAHLNQSGHKLTLMIDSIEQLKKIESYNIDTQIPVCVDVDMSLRLFAGFLHLGVQRSSIRTINELEAVVDYIKASPTFSLTGMMGYEAQVAGLGDSGPFSSYLNPIKKLIRLLSVKKVKAFRSQIARLLDEKNCKIDFFNGGGTGSIHYSANEDVLTEITVGSGLLQSHLFDYYHEGHGDAALTFALEITRRPQENVVTCQSGGFCASGEAGPDKSPVPYLPQNIKSISTEGFGEVQTPFKVGNIKFQLGDPIFCRPSKAGEIAERFEHYFIYSNGQIIDKVKTYRGYYKSFY